MNAVISANTHETLVDDTSTSISSTYNHINPQVTPYFIPPEDDAGDKNRGRWYVRSLSDKGEFSTGTSLDQRNSFLPHGPDVIGSTNQLSEDTIELIGAHGYDRFKRFLNYPENWDGEGAYPLSYRSIGVMERFVSEISKLEDEPSIFLTRAGNLTLGWEDAQDRAIEIEFGPEYIEFFIEGTGSEDRIGISKEHIQNLALEINRVCKI